MTPQLLYKAACLPYDVDDITGEGFHSITSRTGTSSSQTVNSVVDFVDFSISLESTRDSGYNVSYDSGGDCKFKFGSSSIGNLEMFPWGPNVPSATESNGLGNNTGIFTGNISPGSGSSFRHVDQGSTVTVNSTHTSSDWSTLPCDGTIQDHGLNHYNKLQRYASFLENFQLGDVVNFISIGPSFDEDDAAEMTKLDDYNTDIETLLAAFGAAGQAGGYMDCVVQMKYKYTEHSLLVPMVQ